MLVLPREVSPKDFSVLGQITDRVVYLILCPTRTKLLDKYSSLLCEENISMWSRRNTFINIAIHSRRSLIIVVEAADLSNNLSGEGTRVRMDGGDSTTVSKLSTSSTIPFQYIYGRGNEQFTIFYSSYI